MTFFSCCSFAHCSSVILLFFIGFYSLLLSRCYQLCTHLLYTCSLLCILYYFLCCLLFALHSTLSAPSSSSSSCFSLLFGRAFFILSCYLHQRPKQLLHNETNSLSMPLALFPNRGHFMHNKRNNKRHSYAYKKSLALFQSHLYKQIWWEILSCVCAQAFCTSNTIFHCALELYRTIISQAGQNCSIFVARWLLCCKCLVLKLFRSLLTRLSFCSFYTLFCFTTLNHKLLIP